MYSATRGSDAATGISSPDASSYSTSDSCGMSAMSIHAGIGTPGISFVCNLGSRNRRLLISRSLSSGKFSASVEYVNARNRGNGNRMSGSVVPPLTCSYRASSRCQFDLAQVVRATTAW